MEEEKTKEKSYLEDIKETYLGAFLFLLFFGIVLYIFNIIGNIFWDEPRRPPTAEDYKRWEKEFQRNEHLRDPMADQSQQYGGK